MTPEQQEKLNRDYARYCEERDNMAAAGQAIGSFIAWQYAQGVSDIRIAKTWEEHKRAGSVSG